MASDLLKLYWAILPDPQAGEFLPIQTAVAVIAEKIRSLTPNPDISGVMDAVEDLLDCSIAAEGYVIRAPVEEASGPVC